MTKSTGQLVSEFEAMRAKITKGLPAKEHKATMSQFEKLHTKVLRSIGMDARRIAYLRTNIERRKEKKQADREASKDYARLEFKRKQVEALVTKANNPEDVAQAFKDVLDSGDRETAEIWQEFAPAYLKPKGQTGEWAHLRWTIENVQFPPDELEIELESLGQETAQAVGKLQEIVSHVDALAHQFYPGEQAQQKFNSYFDLAPADDGRTVITFLQEIETDPSGERERYEAIEEVTDKLLYARERYEQTSTGFLYNDASMYGALCKQLEEQLTGWGAEIPPYDEGSIFKNE